MPTDRPEEPSRPPRIIVPGAETTPPEGGPRIVLPPGASVEPEADLPEYPRLRPLVIVPIVDRERELLLVSDPLGVIPGQPALGMEALALLQLLDGSASINDITAAIMRESKDLRVGSMVRDFVRQLDELLMLDSPRFHEAYRALRDAYHPLEIRPAALEGHAYPAAAPELKAFLDENFLQAVALRDAARERWPHRTRCRARCWRRTSTRAARARSSRAPGSSWAPSRPSRCASWCSAPGTR